MTIRSRAAGRGDRHLGIDEELLLAEPSRTMSPAGSESVASAPDSTVSMSVVRGFLEAVEQAGIARAEFLRVAGVEASRLDAIESRFPYAEIVRLTELALDLTADPALGLHWAERLSERAFVPISHLIAHSSTLRQGFELLTQFFRLLSDFPAYQVFELEDAVAVRRAPFAGESPRVRAFSSEMMVGGFYRLVASLGVGTGPVLASFAYPAPPHADEYARFFDGAALFDRPFTGLVFDRALLDASPPQKDDDVREALQGLAEQRLARIARKTPYALRVREVLLSEGPARRHDMASVAKALGTSERSLRRRLADEGKSYNDVAEEALAIMAKHLLRDPRRTIQEVAFEMGFSDTSAFHRAFKRWTGTTPNAFREAERR